MVDQNGGAGNDPQPSAATEFKNAAKQETIKWLARLAALVVIVLGVALLTVPIKWALGIYQIEAFLEKMRDDLSASEDTVFVYHIDFVVSNRDRLERIERRMKDAATEQGSDALEDFKPFDLLTLPLRELDDLSGYIGEVDRKDVLRMRARLKSSKVRTVNFSASETAQVTLDYKMSCYREDGGLSTSTNEVAFNIKVNTQVVREGEADLNETGRLYIDQEMLDNFVSIKSNDANYDHRKHELTLVIKDQHREEVISAMAEGELESCRFDALIFVRDVFDEFEQFDALSWIRERTGL
ncbi:MAG: hypothetical protein AAF665_18015 [Pseudomonadota bacterium]